MSDRAYLRIRNFFQQAEKVEHYLASPRKIYSKVQRVTRSILNISPMDLVVKVCGLEDCMPNKLPTSGQKVMHSLHFILRGEGVFCIEDKKEFKLTEGAIFCAMKNIDNTYYPNPDNPWSYIFIGVGGVLSDSIVKYLGLNSTNCVISPLKAKHLKEFFFDVHRAVNEEGQSSLQVSAALYKLFAELEKICCPSKKNIDDLTHHVYNALQAIRNSGFYVTAEVVAKHCGLNRIYLSRIIKEHTGLTLQEIIIATRLFAALDYLKFMDVKTPIAEISRLVGYSDDKYFSKLFKKVFGITPSTYRKQVDKGSPN